MDNDGAFDDATGMNPTVVFEEDGVYPIVLRVIDDGGLFSTDSLSVTIQSSTPIINLPPIAEAGEDIVAGNAVTVIFNGSFSTDPEGKPLIYEWDMDNDGQFDDATGMNPSQVFANNGVYLIALRVTDDGNLTATDTLSITISLADPSLGEIDMPASPLKVNNDLMFSAPITNPGQDDTLSAIWDWNDGMTSAGIMDGQSITGSHRYETPGFYNVTLTLSNKDGGITQRNINKLVVVAPTAASVFGIGWLISPAGSTNANLGEVGKINFDFNASYRRAFASIPSGKTNITIKGKDFKFVSSSYSWLIISGKTSILEGSGTLNGEGNFGLLISVQDGAWFKPNSDKLRIKIWNKENGELIYDTQPGAANDALPTTTVKGFIFTINK